jgi:predicted dehydrogenase
MIRVGVIGLGKMGMLHLRNCRFIDDVEVVAVSDSSKKRLQRAKDMGINRLYSDYSDMLSSADVDAVIVTLPNFLHSESVCLAAKMGKDVFVEKPLGRSIIECGKMIDRVEKEGIRLMVGHNYRFFDCVEKIKREFETGIMGDIELATMELVLNGPFAPSIKPTPVPEWYFDKEKIGMGCLDSGYHLIDLFQWFFGDAKVLWAHLGYRYHLPYEDSAIVVLCSKNGSTRCVLNVGWFSKSIFPSFNFRIILHGTAGFSSTDKYIPRNLFLHAAKEGTKNIARRLLGIKISPLTYTYYYASYFKELRHFFDCIRNNKTPIISGIDSLKTVQIIEEIYNAFT